MDRSTEELYAAIAADDQVEIRRVIGEETITARTSKRAFEDPYAGDGWVVVLRDDMGNELGTYTPVVSEVALDVEDDADKDDTDKDSKPRRGTNKE